MTALRWPATLLGLLLAVGDSQAQFYVGPPPLSPAAAIYGGAYVRSKKVNGVLSFSAGSYGYLSPDYVYGPGYYNSYRSSTTVIITPPPLVILRDSQPPPQAQQPPPRPALEREWVEDMPDRVRPLPPPAARKAPEQIPAPAPMPRIDWPPPLKVEDPLIESDRLVEQGRKAFAGGEYGTARERFRLALKATPGKALPQFLLAQALFAMGKYQEAVDAIHEGLALDSDWPQSAYRSRTLYGDLQDEFVAHTKRLEATLTRHPDDPVLLFLSGYQMWFDSRKDEARTVFRRGLMRGADRADIDRFLRAPARAD